MQKCVGVELAPVHMAGLSCHKSPRSFYITIKFVMSSLKKVIMMLKKLIIMQKPVNHWLTEIGHVDWVNIF